MTRASQFLIFLIISLMMTLISGANDDNNTFVKPIDMNTLGMKNEKASQFQVYWQDVLSGPTPTSIRVVAPPSNSSTLFGFVNMFDNALTIGPELSSEVVGRAQGYYASASQKEVSLLMVMNFVFTKGEYNGSSISIVGRNPVFEKVREMSVVGGSGLFRLARGYAQASTNKFDPKSGDATVGYNVSVVHY